MSKTLAKIRRVVKDIIDIAPRAANKSREWDICMQIVEFATRLAQNAEKMHLTEDELKVYLEHVERERKFLKDKLSGKRRAHPEFSRRKFL